MEHFRQDAFMEKLIQLHRASQVFTKTLSYLSLSRDPGFEIEDLKERWTSEILRHLNVELDLKGELSNESPLILVGNHISYLDILLVLQSGRDLSFVSKKELASWPILGAAASKVKTIFVQRESIQSRKAAREEIRRSLVEDKKRVVIFPSGTTCMSESKPWKKGAFELAFENQIPIQPFRIRYQPLRAVAYIDDDSFFSHLMALTSHKKIKATLEFHAPVMVQDPVFDSVHWQSWTQRSQLD